MGKRKLSLGRIVANIVGFVSLGIVDIIGNIFHGPSRSITYSSEREAAYRHDVTLRRRPARTVNPIEQDLLESVHDKLSQQHFYATLRVVISADDSQRLKDRIDAVRSSMEAYSTSGLQALKARHMFPYALRARYRMFLARHRLPPVIAWCNILSASELASLYHFPSSPLRKAENVVVSAAKTLPAPQEMKRRADTQQDDVVVGLNEHHGEATPLSLTTAERARHMYLVGGTGNGKTTMMEYMAAQDIASGKGIAVIDPHGDMAKKLLRIIPEDRINDVVYINPNDIAHPVGINLVEMPGGLTGDDFLIERGRVTSALVSVMRKVFSEDKNSAHNIEAVMRNVLHTALYMEGATIFTIVKLIRNKKFRKQVLTKVDDERLKDFWREEFGEAGSFQRVSMTKGVTHRLETYESSVQANRMLGQAKSTISFEDIMDSGKILICNLGKGEINEDEAMLFGTTILAKLKMAAERRSRLPEHERRPFYVYVDEFQNFATEPFVTMMSEARKFKLYLTIAEQTTEQQEDPRLTQAILANIRTLVCFGTGSPEDEKVLLPRFAPYVEAGELHNLPSYHFYMKTSVEVPMEPTSGVTLRMEGDYVGDDARRERVIAASRKNYVSESAKPVGREPDAGAKRESAVRGGAHSVSTAGDSRSAKLKVKSIGKQ